MAKIYQMSTFHGYSKLCKKHFGILQNGIENFIFPGRFVSLWAILSVTITLNYLNETETFGFVSWILQFLPRQTTFWHFLACLLTGLIYWLCFCLTLRYTLKLLLMYKGWMYELHGSKVSLMTKIWTTAIKLLLIWNEPRLYSFQRSLPRLPVPSINDTVSRYLLSMRPLLDDENFRKIQDFAKDFQKTIASKLQRYLIVRSWWSSNYITDWWTRFVYLHCRSPLLINSNYYCLDVMPPIDTTVQSARAAFFVYMFLKYRQMIDRHDMLPLMIQELIPFCSSQYERMFNTVRIPGIEVDEIIHYQVSNHIVVMHKGRYFKVIIHHGHVLQPSEIQIQLEEILNSKSEPLAGEERLASLTAWDRTKWAELRNSIFKKGINSDSLHIIESSAFILCLDDEEYESTHQVGLDHMGRSMLHGNGCNRWFDKSFNFCVGTNGRIGFNAEHTWGDGIIMGHMWEYALKQEALVLPYDENGNCRGSVRLNPPSPKRLIWEFNDLCRLKINEAYKDARILIDDLQLRSYRHQDYGKDFIKKCHLSPDAYVQMALQLAYYTDAGQLSLTYESSITRLFLEGRTEAIRSVTIESADWVKSMVDEKSTSEHRISLLRKACARHQRGYKDAMCGAGVDRHLFGLFIVSKYLKLNSPFLNEVFEQKWRLSTSQSTQNMIPGSVVHRIASGSGFGPVANDGYGVSYIITGENELNFHITARSSSRTTDTERFSKHLERALIDIQKLFK